MKQCTILTACYNTPARMIAQWWQSIQDQTWQGWSLLLVDDGSTAPETTVELDRIATDPRCRLVRLPANRGLAAALNVGLRDCRTEWAARTDTDDVAMPHWLAGQHDYIAAHPDADIVGCQITSFDDATGAELGDTRHAEIVDQSVLDAQARRGWLWFLNHPGVFYRPAQILALDGGYNESPAFHRAEDGDLWLRAFRAGLALRVNPAVLQRYRRWPHQTEPPSIHTDPPCPWHLTPIT